MSNRIDKITLTSDDVNALSKAGGGVGKITVTDPNGEGVEVVSSGKNKVIGKRNSTTSWELGNIDSTDTLSINNNLAGSSLSLYTDKISSNKPIFTPGGRVFDPSNLPSASQLRSTMLWGISDYPLGTLISTDIVCGDATASFTIEIVSKSYVNSPQSTPRSIVIEGYPWNGSFYNSSAIVTSGVWSGGISLLQLPNGNIGVWFSNQGYWANYGAFAYVTSNDSSGYSVNRVVGISNSAKPSSPRVLDITPHRVFTTANPPTPAEIKRHHFFASNSKVANIPADTTRTLSWNNVDVLGTTMSPDADACLISRSGRYLIRLGMCLADNTTIRQHPQGILSIVRGASMVFDQVIVLGYTPNAQNSSTPGAITNVSAYFSCSGEMLLYLSAGDKIYYNVAATNSTPVLLYPNLCTMSVIEL